MTDATIPNGLPDEALVPAPQARRDWLGQISEATEWRWRKQFSDFPVPVVINGRKYFRAGDLRRFLAAREAA